MQERQDILSRTIGYLDEEQEALDRGYLLLICSTATMVVGSLLQIFFFYLYNGPFHPFANILVDDAEGETKYSISKLFTFFNFIFFLAEDSNLSDSLNDNIDVDEVDEAGVACDQSTQMENIVDLDKDPLKDDVPNETDV